MMMQPATILSRAEPTRSPWYSPVLTEFIQHVDAPHLHPPPHALRSPDTVLCFNLGPQLYCHVPEPHPASSFTLSDAETLSLVELSHSILFLKIPHASLKIELWFPLTLKIRKLVALTLMTVKPMLQI